MKKVYLFFYASLLIFTSSLSYSDEYLRYHWCYKPGKPLFFASSYDQKLYDKETIIYKKCIQKFIKEQEKDITIHQQAIKKATDDWDIFLSGH